MRNVARRLIDFGMQDQMSRLANLAADFKDRTLAQAKRKGMELGVALGLVMVGLAFVMIAAIAGLFALYLWVGLQYGPFVALAAVGGTAAVLAVLMFVIARKWAGDAASSASLTPSAPEAARRKSLQAGAVVAEQAGAATRQAVNATADFVRTGPRDAVLATLAATMVVGVLLGRRS